MTNIRKLFPGRTVHASAQRKRRYPGMCCVSICSGVLVLQLVSMTQLACAQVTSPALDQATDDTAMPARRALFAEELHALQWGIHIDTDANSILHGGLQRGTVGNNVVHLGLTMDTEKLGGWRGGRIAMSAVRIAGREASVTHIGDLQVADNLDAPASSHIYQFWYRQRFTPDGKEPGYSVRGGLIDFNQRFASTDSASLLLNASFGLNPTLSANIPVSTYPKPGWGLEATTRWSQWQLGLGLFQANPNARNAGFSTGNMLVAELDYQTLKTRYPTRFAFGVWRYHQHDPSLASTPGHDWGSYASIDTALGPATEATHVFLQLGYAPDNNNTVPRYLGLGLEAPSPFPHRPYDRVTAGIAHARINQSAAGSETSYELSYLVNVNQYVTLQPDIQYIAHPDGRIDIQNALVAILRLHLEFD
ncbi:MAG: carbohydrate porin [Gammaproteobacteria bacterium]